MTYPLSPQEIEVMAGIMAGQSNKDIAKGLGSTEQTVKSQTKSILRKMECTSRLELASRCFRAALALPCPKCGHIDGGAP